ncbi:MULTISPECIES: MarR family winged helix-turn-helix transcriptional regulator [unclassified Glutamicibacter]|uniref:MarR family winged helix-turn-helix transcriptional regulator n=1 Tax=unclassified Glutamicibacter TaxID=2627139 RepID=UPI0037F9FA6C
MQVSSKAEDVPATQRPDLYASAEQELFSLIALTTRAKRELATRLDSRLTPGYLPVLGMILRSQRITQSEICEHLLVDKAALSRMITKLEQLALVKREVDPEDRRVFHILPTELAVERWHECFQGWRTELRSRMTNWDNEDLSALIDLLSRLNLEIKSL